VPLSGAGGLVTGRAALRYKYRMEYRMVDVRVLAAFLVALPLTACGGDELVAPLPRGPAPLAPLPGAPLLTTERTLTVLHAMANPPSLNPSVPEEMDQMLMEGFGDVDVGPGQPISPATLDDAPPPSRGQSPKLLTRFVHLADAQLADDESPSRLAVFDGPGAFASAFRPQEGHECRILNAAVRTINAFHRKTPVDFVLLGGDNADSAQTNEISWFMAILDGERSVECDSGKDDDPLAGPDNDPKDPFIAEGLLMPWRWETGNHDILNQGNFQVSGHLEDTVGGVSLGGTRDWSLPGAPVVKGEVPADAKRVPLSRAELMEQIGSAGDGHGIGAAEKAYGKAYYWFDIAGSQLRIIVLDTAAETGGPNGVVHQADVDKFIKPALDQAKRDKKWVILTSHHASRLLGDGAFVGSEKQVDALTVEAWQSLVGGYDNVLLHLAGHTHVHRVLKTAPPGGHAYWELETSALADYPSQMRVMEVWDEDNGYLTIRGIALDYVADNDPIAEDGRRRSVVDYTSGFERDGSGAPEWRNVELWIKKPE
jgi:3',5'-cyclic AMP phosphodiesterase CpdA